MFHTLFKGDVIVVKRGWIPCLCCGFRGLWQIDRIGPFDLGVFHFLLLLFQGLFYQLMLTSRDQPQFFGGFSFLQLSDDLLRFFRVTGGDPVCLWSLPRLHLHLRGFLLCQRCLRNDDTQQKRQRDDNRRPPRSFHKTSSISSNFIN